MGGDTYALARQGIGEILLRCDDMRRAELVLFDYLNTRPWEATSTRHAVAMRLVVLLTKGIEDPRHKAWHQIIAPNGRVIVVHVVDSEQNGISGGQCVSTVTDRYDELALVVFRDGLPSVVHIVDMENFPSVVEGLAGGGRGGDIPAMFRNQIALNDMFHFSIMLDPTVAEVLGVRTFVLDTTVGFRRQDCFSDN